MSNRYQEGYINGCRKTRDEMQAEIHRLRDALGSAGCPRPANAAPDDTTVAQCVQRLECGCDLGAALEQAQPNKYDPRSGPCPTCGFQITVRKPEPFVFDDEDES